MIPTLSEHLWVKAGWLLSGVFKHDLVLGFPIESNDYIIISGCMAPTLFEEAISPSRHLQHINCEVSTATQQIRCGTACLFWHHGIHPELSNFQTAGDVTFLLWIQQTPLLARSVTRHPCYVPKEAMSRSSSKS